MVCILMKDRSEGSSTLHGQSPVSLNILPGELLHKSHGPARLRLEA